MFLLINVRDQYYCLVRGILYMWFMEGNIYGIRGIYVICVLGTCSHML
jgi:hypothetical protein